MVQNNSPIINFSSSKLKDIKSFCKLNELDINEFVKSCFDQGYNIEKYGLINSDGVKVIEREVIKEVPVEVIKEVEKIVQIENTEKIDELLLKIQQLEKDLKKKPKTVTKKVEVEIPVEVVKEVYITDDEQVNELGGKLAELDKEKQKFSTNMEEMENNFQKEKEQSDTQISAMIRKIDDNENEKSELERKLFDMKILLEKKPKEIIKEVKSAGSPEKLKALQETIQKLRDDLREKDKTISHYENILLDLDKQFKDQRATFLGSTNLNNELKNRKL